MTSLKMTPEQERAVTTLEGDLVISAGAGAGKTSVLGHRFSHALAHGVGGVETAIDRLLTITFTAKAAAEVAERIRRVLTTGGEAEDARRIDEAWVSTIHSFCGRLVRRHVLECGVEPYFATADEVVTSALKADAFEKALERLLAEDFEISAKVLEAEGTGSLFSCITQIHDKARSLGLDPSAARLPVEPGDEGEALTEVITRAEDLSYLLGELSQTPALVSKRERLEQWRAELASCDMADDAKRCERLLGLCEDYDVSRLSGEAKDANTDLKIAIERLARASAAYRHRDVLGWLERLTSAYADCYVQEKVERGLLDFDDLQEAAVRLLEGSPEVAERYRSHFDLLMIDEFQDTNALQMRVLEPLRRKNLCVVGDERQAIYGFRYADVEIFKAAKAASPTVSLAKNFRSRAEVLAFVNALFSQAHLFGEEFVRLEPGRELVAGQSEPVIECTVVDGSDCKAQLAQECEARWVARSIAEKIAIGYETGDVAILLRRSTHAAAFAAALEAEGIPAIVNAGVSLHDTLEATELRDLLRALAVPEDDEAMLATLVGCVVALDDATLHAVSQASGRDSLWSGLLRLSEAPDELAALGSDQADAVVQTRTTFERLARLRGRERLGEFVRTAAEAFDYDITLHAQGAAGIRAWSNVLAIARIAERFETVEGNDLAEFVAHLDARSAAAVDPTAPSEADGGAVRIMTVHAAKGLEFPVVYVADLAAGKEHALSSVLVSASDDESPYPVVGVKLSKAFNDATTAEYTQREAAERTREVEEAKRCLYVACTRAKEVLMLSGVSAIVEPAQCGRALIDWVREGLSEGSADGVVRLGDAEVLLHTITPEHEETGGAAEAQPDCDTPANTGGPITHPLPEEIAPPVPAETIPSTVSYSALSLLARCPLAFDARYRLHMRPMEQVEGVGALEFGSAVHAVLRAVLEGEPEESAIARVARTLKFDENLVARTIQALEGFLGSGLCEEVRGAERFACEQPLLVPLKGTVLVGSVDLIAWRGDRALIVDYKSGEAPAEDAGASAAGTDAESDARGAAGPNRGAQYLLQAQCYALAAIEAGADEAEVTFAFIEHPGRYKTFRFGAQDCGEIRGAIQGVADIANQPGPAVHLASYDRWLCGSCAASGTICPVVAPVAPRSAAR